MSSGLASVAKSLLLPGTSSTKDLVLDSAMLEQAFLRYGMDDSNEDEGSDGLYDIDADFEHAEEIRRGRGSASSSLSALVAESYGERGHMNLGVGTGIPQATRWTSDYRQQRRTFRKAESHEFSEDDDGDDPRFLLSVTPKSFENFRLTGDLFHRGTRDSESDIGEERGKKTSSSSDDDNMFGLDGSSDARISNGGDTEGFWAGFDV